MKLLLTATIAALTLAAAGAARANIVASAVNVTNDAVNGLVANDGADGQALITAGFQAYVVTLTATGTGNAGMINTIDFKNGTNWGIRGTLHQAWDTTSSSTNWVSSSNPGTLTNEPTPAGLDQRTSNVVGIGGLDSQILAGLDVITDAPAEDNTLAGSVLTNVAPTSKKSGTHYITSSTGEAYGLGSFLTLSGSDYVADQVGSLQLAYVIAKGSFTVKGEAWDNTDTGSLINSTFGATVPEPASLGLLGMGVLGLIARRRKA